MPRRDGRGPMNNGPLTGRGLGNCENTNNNQVLEERRRLGLGRGFGQGRGRNGCSSARRGCGRGLSRNINSQQDSE